MEYRLIVDLGNRMNNRNEKQDKQWKQVLGTNKISNKSKMKDWTENEYGKQDKQYKWVIEQQTMRQDEYREEGSQSTVQKLDSVVCGNHTDDSKIMTVLTDQ